MNRLVCEPVEMIGTPAAPPAAAPLWLASMPRAMSSAVAERSAARSVGINGVAAVCVALQLTMLLAAAPGYSAYGLHIQWWTGVPQLVTQAMFVVLWLHFRKYPGGPHERILPDVVLVLSLMIMLTNIASPAQYVAVALKRPLIDPWLARADAMFGVHVPALAQWTAGHPVLAILLTLCYFSLFPQFLMPIILLGLLYRNRERLWEYAFHFHFCLAATLLALALFPAECAFQFYGFPSTIDQSHFISHFQALRNGTFHVLVFADLEGLISMPSFHVAGALMVTWAFRGYRRVAAPLIVLNIGLIAATFMSGAHYFVDVIASILLFAISVFVYRAPQLLRLDSVLRGITRAPAEALIGTEG